MHDPTPDPVPAPASEQKAVSASSIRNEVAPAPPIDDDLIRRVARLEEALGGINNSLRSLTYSVEHAERNSAFIRDNFATQADIERMRGEANRSNGDMQVVIGALKGDVLTKIGEVRAEVYKSLNEQTWKIIGCVGALAAAIYFIATHVKVG